MRRTLLLLSVLLFPLPGAAQEAPRPPNTPEGVDRVVALREGQPAPFSGQLLDTDTAIRWTFRLEWYAAEVPRQVRLRVDSLRLTEESWQTRLDLVEESYLREVAGLREDNRALAQRLARAQNPGFFRTTSGGFVIGVGISLVLVIGGYLLLGG